MVPFHAPFIHLTSRTTADPLTEWFPLLCPFVFLAPLENSESRGADQ